MPSRKIVTTGAQLERVGTSPPTAAKERVAAPVASRSLDATFAGRKLRGYRNVPPADRQAAIDALLRLAQFAADFPQVEEVEINPLRVQLQSQRAVAVDVRMKIGD